MNLSSGIMVFEIPSVKDKLTKHQLEFWNQWVEALRSDKYKQSRSALRNRTGFSCLGVAADILITQKTAELNWGEPQLGMTPLMYMQTDVFLSILPSAVMRKVGLIVEFPKYAIGEEFQIMSSKGLPYSLGQLNLKGSSFEEISNILEIALKGGYKNKR